MKKGKLLIFSAPSGSGKTTIVNSLLERLPDIGFSVSVTSRKPRGEEKDGVHYHFVDADKFRELIDSNALIEWEEVYKDHYYGTLKSEVERIRAMGHHVVFDVDVVGGLNLKKYFGKDAISIFIMPPSVEELRTRLEKRGTDNREKIEMRIAKAETEIAEACNFDHVIVNTRLESAILEAIDLVEDFTK